MVAKTYKEIFFYKNIVDNKHSSWKLNQILKKKGYIYYVGNGDIFTLTDN